MEFALESMESPALTKAALADLLYDNIGLNKREAKDMVDALFDIVTERLVSGDDVKITGFGNFQIRSKSSRPGAIRERASPWRLRLGVW
jgi:integration host factor subunit alpha